jgi:AraC-like DNA-binding protein
MTFSRWRQQLQIIVAIQKLSAGETVQSVSGALGYESVSAFITMFKKALGKSPARYFSEREADQTLHLRVDLAGDGLPAPPDAPARPT